MKLADLVREDAVILGFGARDRWHAIELLAAHLVATKRIRPEQRRVVHEALVAREKVASTGMENGVALPHAQIDGLDEAAAVFAVAPKGVPFDCVDGKPATLIALLVIPKRSIQAHIRTLAGIARLLNYEEMRRALLAAKSPREVAEIVAAEEAREFA